MKTNKTRRGAFTLVEMLVVVGIIALLAGIAFPVFSRVREGGRRASCTSNLKQLGLGFQQYLQDSAGRFPLAGNYQDWAKGGNWVTGGRIGEGPHDFVDAATPAEYGGGGLAGSSATGPDPFKTIDGREAKVEYGALFPYIKNASTYICPTAKDGKERKLSYSMNCAIAGLRQFRIKNPAQIVLLVDEGETLNDGYFWATSQFGNQPTDSLFDGHNGGGNILFTDGSVRFFTFQQLPLDWNGAELPPAGSKQYPVGSGIYLKGAMTGDVRFHDAAFGRKFGTSDAIVGAGGTTNACFENISTP